MVAGAAADPGGTTIETRVDSIERELIALMNKLKEYEQQQDSWKHTLANQVAHETGKVVGGLTELHKKVEQTLTMFNERLNANDERWANADQSDRRGTKTLLAAKDMKPATLEKEEQWRKWKSDIEDYCEEVFTGMKEMMDKTKNADVELCELWFEETEMWWWNRSEALYRFLERYT